MAELGGEFDACLKSTFYPSIVRVDPVEHWASTIGIEIASADAVLQRKADAAAAAADRVPPVPTGPMSTIALTIAIVAPATLASRAVSLIQFAFTTRRQCRRSKRR